MLQVNRIRAKNRINVHGCDVPDPVCTFDELQTDYGLHLRLLHNLRDAGLNSPTAIQMQAIPLMMHVGAQTLRIVQLHKKLLHCSNMARCN